MKDRQHGTESHELFDRNHVINYLKNSIAYAVANIEVKGRMADVALCTRASSVGKWKSGVAKKYDFCLSRRSEAHGVGSVMSTTSGNYTLFAGLERK